jgi:hypothetical protein
MSKPQDPRLEEEEESSRKMTLGKKPPDWREHILALGLSWLYQSFFLVSIRMMIPIDWVNQEVTKA